MLKPGPTSLWTRNTSKHTKGYTTWKLGFRVQKQVDSQEFGSLGQKGLMNVRATLMQVP